MKCLNKVLTIIGCITAAVACCYRRFCRAELFKEKKEMPSWKRILKVPSSNDQTDVKISAAEFHFSAALVFYALTFKNESLFIVTPMQNLKHNGKLGFGVLYGALEAHAAL